MKQLLNIKKPIYKLDKLIQYGRENFRIHGILETTSRRDNEQDGIFQIEKVFKICLV